MDRFQIKKDPILTKCNHKENLIGIDVMAKASSNVTCHGK